MTSSVDEYGAGMAPFELLPNEMAEIPIKMAMAKMHRPLQKYEFLANVIAKISTRETSERANGECACGHIFWKFSRFTREPCH